MQNQNVKHKIKLKDRTDQYSIKMIEFLDNLTKDGSAQIISKQLSEQILLKPRLSVLKKISLNFLIILSNLPMKAYIGLVY